MKNLLKGILFVCILSMTLQACGAKSPLNILPPTLPPLVEPVSLDAVPFSEENQTPVYKITGQLPQLAPATHPSVAAFNNVVKSVVDAEIAAFKGSMAEMPATPISAGSSLDIQYELIGQKGSIWSIRFNILGYADGAAHPYRYSITVNYDLENVKQLNMDDIFTPNSSYLQVISDYCKSELTARAIGFDEGFQQGAEPTPENYKNWNVSNEGLVITFDEYQVAPYAAGPQIMVIPFVALSQVIDPQGPLVLFFSQ